MRNFFFLLQVILFLNSGHKALAGYFTASDKNFKSGKNHEICSPFTFNEPESPEIILNEKTWCYINSGAYTPSMDRLGALTSWLQGTGPETLFRTTSPDEIRFSKELFRKMMAGEGGEVESNIQLKKKEARRALYKFVKNILMSGNILTEFKDANIRFSKNSFQWFAARLHLFKVLDFDQHSNPVEEYKKFKAFLLSSTGLKKEVLEKELSEAGYPDKKSYKKYRESNEFRYFSANLRLEILKIIVTSLALTPGSRAKADKARIESLMEDSLKPASFTSSYDENISDKTLRKVKNMRIRLKKFYAYQQK